MCCIPSYHLCSSSLGQIILPLLAFVFLTIEWAQERLEGVSETVCVRAAGLAWDGLLVPGRRQHFLGPQA